MNDWLGLKEKCCVITGATGGLGRAMVLGFLQVGAKVVLLDRSAELDAGFRDELSVFADRYIALGVDVRAKRDLEAAFSSAANRFGPLHVLVNNAALSAPSPLAEADLETWQNQFAVNVGGYLQCAQSFRRRRDPDQPAAIVNVASIAGRNAQPFSGGYASTKAAILMLSRQLAVEWGPEGIRTNSVSPGLFLTPMTRKFYANPQDRSRREQVVPLHRIGGAAELANAVMFLASPRAAYVNGAEIIVDGGFSQTLMAHIPRPYEG